MSASEAEVARPTLRPRGLLGVAEPILTAGGRAMGEYTEAFVGIDAAKARNAIAVAEGGRGGEVRYLGEVDAWCCRWAPRTRRRSRSWTRTGPARSRSGSSCRCASAGSRRWS